MKWTKYCLFINIDQIINNDTQTLWYTHYIMFVERRTLNSSNLRSSNSSILNPYELLEGILATWYV